MGTAILLIIHDDADVVAAVRAAAGAAGVERQVVAGDALGFAEHLDGSPWTCAVLGWPLSWHDPALVLGLLRRRHPDRPVFALAADVDGLGAALDAGAARGFGTTMKAAAALQRALAGLEAETADRAEGRPADALRRAAALQERISAAPDIEQMRRLSKRLLAVCIDELRDGERALQLCLDWRRRDPNNEDLERILLDMLERLQRWETLGEVLEQAAGSAEGARREELLGRLEAVRRRTGQGRGGAGALEPLPPAGDSVPALRTAMAEAADALRATGPVGAPPPVPVAARPDAVAHDLGAPARAVARYLEALQEDHGDALLGEAGELVERAKKAAVRLQERIAHALGGAAERDPEVDVDELLLDVLADLSAELDAAGATVTHDPLPTLSTDRKALSRVLQNLIANALRHGGDSPKIHVGALARRGGWELLVRDDGPGLPEAVELFSPGGRGEDGHGGRGLGLAICRDLVRRLGGRIGARSGPDGGTTVHFTLPDPGHARGREEARARSAEPGGADPANRADRGRLS